VAGSNGKTTTKELLAALLGSRYRTLRSEASHNNDVGVPMTLLRMDSRHEAAVLEAGTNHPGELAPLARMIAPEIGLVTSIGREHLEHFGGIDGVVAEEGSLGEELPPAGVLVINGDHGHAGVLAARTRAHVVKAGFAPGNAWRPRVVESRWESTLFLLSAPGPEWNGEFEIGLPGRHMVANAAVALAAAAAMGVAPDDAREALARFRGAKQRLQWSDLGVAVLGDMAE
jgi:UDP-N-acetylmuramoyl-tripeptide--D-alanyl-D-alanine ligase